MKQIVILFFLIIYAQFSYAEICGKTDDRVISHDPKVGRLSREGEHGNSCTVTLISDKCAITAGNCITLANHAEFNTPLSIGGIPQPSNPEDQYLVERGNWEFSNSPKIGQQWAVIKFKQNEITGLYPGQTQGFYEVASTKHPNREAIRVVSYGYSNVYGFPVPDGDIKNFAQQSSEGSLVSGGIFLMPSLMYFLASDRGGPGAPIISKATNEILGIATHGGCESTDRNNINNGGTFIYGQTKFKKAIAACLAK